MNIGQAAKRSGISSKMIRYYEQIGLLPNVQRSASGYRVYSAQDVEILNFLRHARDLGFSSEQMKELLGLWQNSGRQSAEVKQLTLKHIQHLNEKIAQLQEMVSWLQHSANDCLGDQSAECAILNHLAQGKIFANHDE